MVIIISLKYLRKSLSLNSTFLPKVLGSVNTQPQQGPGQFLIGQNLQNRNPLGNPVDSPSPYEPYKQISARSLVTNPPFETMVGSSRRQETNLGIENIDCLHDPYQIGCQVRPSLTRRQESNLESSNCAEDPLSIGCLQTPNILRRQAEHQDWYDLFACYRSSSQSVCLKQFCQKFPKESYCSRQ